MFLGGSFRGSLSGVFMLEVWFSCIGKDIGLNQQSAITELGVIDGCTVE